MNAFTFEQALQSAVAHHQAGELAQAETLYRQILATQPKNPDALHLLGLIAQQVGHHEAAVDLISRAIDEKSDNAAFHLHLGNALLSKQQFNRAIACYSRALALRPDYPEAYNNLGNTWKEQGEVDQAIPCYRRALALKPDYAEASYNLGSALQNVGQLAEAIECYQQALAAKPDFAEAHNNLGNTFAAQGKQDAAIACFRQALTLNPNYAEAHNNLGNALRNAGKINEALPHFAQALTLKPDFAEARSNLGAVWQDQGRLDQAMTCYRQAMSLAPNESLYQSNLIYAMHFQPGVDPTTLLAEHRQWARQHEQSRRHFIRPYSNDPDPNRRLKVGYVSPDLREHPVGRFLMPLLQNHDHGQFQVACYADVDQPDAVTEQLRMRADYWRVIVGVSEEQLAAQIREDGMDILVDLTLHANHNRLPVFARKPAPVQVTYLAYAGTSGMDAMDYRLTDPYLDPPGENDDYYSEISIRLPDTYWCYPAPETNTTATTLPALPAGRVTFGCLNNFSKVNERVLSVWARILRAMPNSRLRLHAREGSHRARILEVMTVQGVAAERISFQGYAPSWEYFGAYHQIDIALDTFPYAGGTTTCDALWMGVPVVSLVGQTAVGRGGLSILSNIGLPELAARTEDEYVKIAVELANDLPRLARLRETMRERMQASPLMDAPRFAKNIEHAYRTMWRTWCEARK